MKRKAKEWARVHVLGELREMLLIGFACNVQEWSGIGEKRSAKTCALRRREARRLVRVAMGAVSASGPAKRGV